MRNISFSLGEYYHVYNRGVEKRSIVEDLQDSERFLQSMNEFNTLEPIGSIYENSFLKEACDEKERLVSFVAYCLNPNHYHFILTPLVENGVERFMQRLGTGYTMYFNNKIKRSGALFQGRFKALHINSNEYLLHLSAYVNLNDRVHQLGGPTSKLARASWNNYIANRSHYIPCKTDIILDQFDSLQGYINFAEESLEGIINKKKHDKELDALYLE